MGETEKISFLSNGAATNKLICMDTNLFIIFDKQKQLVFNTHIMTLLSQSQLLFSHVRMSHKYLTVC